MCINLNNYRLMLSSIIAISLLNACQLTSTEDIVESIDDNISQDQYIEPEVANTVVASDKPIVAIINTEAIFENVYRREVLRYEAALEKSALASARLEEYSFDVLEQLISSKLISQAAREQGLKVTRQQVDTAYADSISARGGQAGFDKWLEENIYTESEFQNYLEEQLLAAKIQEVVLSNVGIYAEQVHARHIVVATREQAEDLAGEIVAGADFATIAALHSLDRSTRLNGGDLGWFPKGLLTTPVLEAEAFVLDPGEVGGIVETEIGFHILQTMDHDSQRELTPNAAVVVKRTELEKWLTDLRGRAVIERFVQ